MRVAGARGLRLGVVGAKDFEGAGVAGCSGEGLVLGWEVNRVWSGGAVCVCERERERKALAH